MLRRFRSMTACWCRSRSKTLTWIRWPVFGNQVSTSTETKKSVEVGVAVLEPQAPLDRVVVGERDEVHPAGLGEPVDLLRVVVGVVAVGRLEVLENGGVRVDVEVRPREREGRRRRPARWDLVPLECSGIEPESLRRGSPGQGTPPAKVRLE